MGGPVAVTVAVPVAAAVIPSIVKGTLLLSTGTLREEEEEDESSPNNLDPVALVVVVRVKGPLLDTGILREYEEEDLANLIPVMAVVVVVVLVKGPLLCTGTRREELVDFFVAAVVKFVGFLILSSELLFLGLVTRLPDQLLLSTTANNLLILSAFSLHIFRSISANESVLFIP